MAPYLADLASPLRLRDSGLYKDSGEPTESGEDGRTYQYNIFFYIVGIVIQLSVQKKSAFTIIHRHSIRPEIKRLTTIMKTLLS